MLFIRQINVHKIFLNFPRRYQHKLSKGNLYNMNKAYFRHVDGDENFDLTFIYTNPSLGINRQFNFCRQSAENVGTLLGRITTNVEKTLSKKKNKKAKKNECTPTTEATPIQVKLVQNGEELSRDVVCINAIKVGAETELCILDNTFKIMINAPWITTLALPASILAGFPVYPSKLEGFFLKQNFCNFHWYSAKIVNKADPSRATWNKVGEGYTYFTTTADIGKKLKLICIPGDGCTFGPEVEAISANEVEAGPGFCPFENRHSFTQEKLSGKSFRAVSYNILADLYCDSDFTRTVLHPYCPPYALHIDYRKQLLSKEILGYNSDIICLQEVDRKVFVLDLTPLLNEHSYEGIHTKKGGQVTEGLACFFRAERFKLLENFSCVLGENVKTSAVFSSIWSMICTNDAFVTRLVNRTTTVQAVVLQSLDNTNEVLVVGNTHLYFHPDADHVRITQGGLVITWLQNIIEETKKKMPGKRISLILCGDFNSVPSCGIYQLYTTGVAPSDLVDWKSNESEALSNVTLTQTLPLASACGTPEFTNFTVGFADCLDYIFHDREHLKVTQVVPLPSVEELNQNTALPSIFFPSDHIALIADLEFK